MQTILILLALLALNAFFSIAEMSITSSRKLKLQQLIDSGDEAAKKVMYLIENPEKYISVVQIGLNMVAILSGVFGEGALAPVLQKALTSVPFINESVPASAIAFFSTAVAVIAITWIFIAFAELVPKKIAIAHREQMACSVVNPILFIIKILNPFITSLNSTANFVLRLLRVKISVADTASIADIYAMVEQGNKEGLLVNNEKHLIRNVFKLDERTVSSAMTQRSDIVYLDIQDDEQTIKEKISTRPHSRFLLCDSDIDHVLGYVDASKILIKILKQASIVFNREKLNESNLKPILIVPDSISLLDLLDKFKESREDISVVVSEYGLVVGLVTLNDIMATLMGEALPMPEENTLIVKRPNSPNSWIIDGKASIADVRHLFSWDTLPYQDSYETISGFLTMLMKKIPKRGERVMYEGVEFEIVDLENYRIDQVIATIATSPKKDDK